MGPLLLLCVAALTLAQAVPDSDLPDQNAFLDFLSQHEFKAFFFHNSTACPKCGGPLREMAERLRGRPFTAANQVALAVVDVRAIPRLQNQFRLSEKPAFAFYFRMDRFDFPDFSRQFRLLLSHELPASQLDEALEHHVLKALGSYAREVWSLDQLRQVASQHSSLALYLGPPNYDFEMFLRFAYVYPDLPFYFVHNETLGRLFLDQYGNSDPFSVSHLAVVRGPAHLDEEESSGVAIFRGVRNFMVVKRFLEFEKAPRLRRVGNFDRDLFDFIAHKERMLLYVGNGNLTDSANFREFKSAIRLLPKSLVYCYSQPSLENFPYLMHLFDLAGSTVGVETLYFLHLVPGTSPRIEIAAMKKPITKEHIIEFVIDFFKRHQGEIREVPFLDLSVLRRNAPGSSGDKALP